jgi:cell wall-associated NlpC family hydrolase/nucleoid-associated protein YgaU
MPTDTGWLAQFASLFGVELQPSRQLLHLMVLSIGVLGVGGALTMRPPAAPAAVAEAVVEPAAAERAEPRAAEDGTAGEAAAPAVSTHVVQAGETLNKLAERFSVSVATLAAANKLDDPDLISEGQELVVPAVSGVLHAVGDGETLDQVAERYGVEPAELARVNHVPAAPSRPVERKQLVVPGVEPPLFWRSGQAGAGVDSARSGRGETTLASLTVGANTAGAQAPRATPRGTLSYTVQEGDTLDSLAIQFGVSTRTLLVANNLDDPDLITVGKTLKVLPVSGVEHEVEAGETLSDIAAAYKVDLGPIVDFNGLADPDSMKVGAKIVIPGATARVVVPVVVASAPRGSSQSGDVVAIAPQVRDAPRAAAQSQAAAPARVAPAPSVGGGSSSVVKNAMAYLGSRYVFGGTSPAGFDCSGFVWYVHNISGSGTSRGLWGQLNGGPRISRENLQPGDTVFFANTYMPGLSHAGIYVGGGRFVHAIDESRGVGVSSLSEGYWSSRYVGASRLW